MSSGYQKMLAMPADSENSFKSEEIEVKSNSPKKKVNVFFDKITRIMKIFLRLANIKGYDLIGRVRDSNGNFMKDSDIISLISHSLTHGKLLLGQNEFINLLYEAKIEPELIINENVKSRLLNLYSDKNTDSIENSSVTVINEDKKDDEIRDNKSVKKKSLKRKIDRSAEDNISNAEEVGEANVEVIQPSRKKPKVNWDINNSDEKKWEFNE